MSKLTIKEIGVFLAKMAEKSDSVYWLSSPDLQKIIYISSSYEKIWGRPRQILYDNPELWISYLHPDDIKNYHPIHELRDHIETLGDKARYAEEYRIIRADQEIRWIIDRGFPIFDESGKCLGVTGVAVDVTELKENEKLRTQKEEAEKKAKYMNMAAGTIAHDLRTPLATINLTLSFAESVLPELLAAYQWAYSNGYPGQHMGKDYIEGISSAVDNCRREVAFSNHYIDMILGNLKHDSIDTSNYQTHNIIKVIDYALATYPYREGQKELLHWQPTVDFDFWGHDYYIKNIINNLLKNSYYFIEKADRGEIYLTTAENKTHYLLLVKDTAEGAAPEILAHLFDGYFSKRQGGTGLGLAFCKAIMRSFEGDVTVESVQGEFIEFTLHFPKRI